MLFSMNYFNTYYFSNIIDNVLDDFDYIRTLDDFFGLETFFESYPKRSALHRFIEFCIDSLIYEELDKSVESIIKYDVTDYRYKRFWIEEALLYHKIPHKNFIKWIKDEGISKKNINEDDAVEYLNHLRDEGAYNELMEILIDEVFYILFLNRGFLLKFNNYISHYISRKLINELELEEVRYFQKDGVLKRCYLPKWVKRAVFFRDRGRCCICHKDLTNLISLEQKLHYDHIVALDEGGINDVTNIQLLCDNCNFKKGSGAYTSNLYEYWYEKD